MDGTANAIASRIAALPTMSTPASLPVFVMPQLGRDLKALHSAHYGLSPRELSGMPGR
jgi:hypothetical protein